MSPPRHGADRPSDEELNAITEGELRARAGGEKWARYPDCIAAFVAEMDFGTAPVVSDALQDAITRGALGYMPEPLANDLGEACAELYEAEWGWSPPAGWIKPIADVIKGAEIAVRLFSPPDSKVILPTPIYMPFVGLPSILGREAIQVSMLPEAAENGKTRWKLDLEGIDDAFAQGGHTLILCNPANPTGRVFTPEELNRLATVVDAHDGRVFADEIHAPLTFRGHRHTPYASLSEMTASHTVTSFSASKAWNVPGLKCAQILFSNPDDLDHWERHKGFLGYGASTLGAIANIAAFRSGGPWLARIIEYLDLNRSLFNDILGDLAPRARLSALEGTYLTWLDLRDTELGRKRRPLAPKLRRTARVAVTEGADCGDAGHGFVRFNLALPRPLLERAASALATATLHAG